MPVDQPRVVIAGAGVIGLCTAYYCALRGARVTVVERAPEQRDGCSFGNAGMIVPSHFIPLAAPGMVAMGLKWMWNPESPFYIKPRLSWDLIDWGLKFWHSATPAHVRRSAPLLRDLNLASRAAFEELEDQPGIDFGLVKKGLVMLCKTQHALDEEARTAKMANDLGVPARVLDAKQTAALDPAVTMDVAGSVYFPKDCHLVPNRFIAALQTRLKEMGGDFLWNSEITGWETAPGRRVRAVKVAGGREIEADEFILCGGSWSPAIARDLGLKIPIQPGKGFSLTVPNPRELPEICSIFTEARVAITPMDGALRFGGTMEMSGMNESTDPRRVHGIIKSVPDYYPKFQVSDFDGIQPWRGLRPCSPDGLPYIGRTARYDNLVVATGHAMMGLSLAPVTGQIAAALVAGEKPAYDLAQLSPDRFA